MNRIAYIFVILCMLFAVNTSRVAAVEIPSFPQCLHPGGEIIAQYASGVHGVPGDSTTYTGMDAVFKLNDAQIVQCLCPDTGSGIQTLWWKDPGLSESDEAKVISQGWIRVPNGQLWGLEKTKYFAKNSNFSCKEGGGNGGHVNGSSDSKSSDSSSGSILGVTTLAGTGNWMTIIGVFFLAAGAVMAGMLTRKASR